jgi:hypothetical protein
VGARVAVRDWRQRQTRSHGQAASAKLIRPHRPSMASACALLNVLGAIPRRPPVSLQLGGGLWADGGARRAA